MSTRIMVTSALPYVNGPLHLGHLAGAYLPADVFCRYQRLEGRPTLFICGSDEHGAAIVRRGFDEQRSPREVVDQYHRLAEETFRALGVSFDHYGRTSAPIHHETSQDFFRRVAEAGAFTIRSEEQLYDPEAKLFLADRFVIGTCPSCGYDGAFGDQCEKCGTSLSPAELKDPRSTLTQAVPELRTSTHWYLHLGEHLPRIEPWLDSRTHWKSNVLGQIGSWRKKGLGDRAMTRDLPWGVPVPADIAEAAGVDPEGKVLYVWFDAPIGYISATREWAAKRGDPEAWEPWWKDEGTRLVHFIGKDNIVFHTLIFPILLALHGGYVLPEDVPANEFLNLEGDKFSTSRGWAVWAHEALEHFPADYLRYSLLRILPETQDSDFTWSELKAHVNNELADNLGNFVNRTVAFATKYLDGRVPTLTNPTERDRETLAALADFPEKIGGLIDTHHLRSAIQSLMDLGRLGNKYFNDSEPWATRRTDPVRCGDTIHVALQICASLGILAEPFLPSTAARIRETVGLVGLRPSDGSSAEGELGWRDAGRPLLQAGAPLGTPQILVEKVTDEAIEAELERLHAASLATSGPPYAPLGDMIAFDDFAKLDLRVGVVRVCERVKKSKKLLRCEVDLGFETRQILAGVAEHLEPEALLGKGVIVVANLAPRKMLGLESQGMLLMATDRSGALTPIFSDREPGSRVS